MFSFFFKNVREILQDNINIALKKDLYGTLLKFFVIFSVILLLADIFAEFLLNTHNCSICGYPRIPYYSILLLFILNLKYKDVKLKIYTVKVSIFLMFVGFCIAIYNTLLIYQILHNNYNCNNMVGASFYNGMRDGNCGDTLYIYKYIANNGKCEFSSLMISSFPFVLWEGIVFLLTFLGTLSTAIFYNILANNIRNIIGYTLIAICIISTFFGFIAIQLLPNIALPY